MNRDAELIQLRKKLSHEVRGLRLKKGLSQEGLALAAGVDRTYVSQLERGVANPSLAILWRVAEALNARLLFSLGEKELL